MDAGSHIDESAIEHSINVANDSKPDDGHNHLDTIAGDSTNSTGNGGKRGSPSRGGGSRRNNNARSPNNRGRGGKNFQAAQGRPFHAAHNNNSHHFHGNNGKPPFRRIGPSEAAMLSRRSELLNIIRIEHMKVDIYKSSNDLSSEEREDGIRSARLAFDAAKEEWTTLGVEVAVAVAAAAAEAEAAKAAAAAAGKNDNENAGREQAHGAGEGAIDEEASHQD